MSKGSIVIISLHADPSLPSGIGEGGGTHAYVRELIAGLTMRGRVCNIITRRFSPMLEKSISISPLSTLYRIDLGSPGILDKKKLNDLHKQSLMESKAVIALMEDSPTVIHSVYWNSGRVAMDLSEELGIPFVHTVISNGKGRLQRGATEHATDREVIELAVFKSAHRIFSISADEKKDLVELYQLPAEKIIVIGRPVDAVYTLAAHDETGTPQLFFTNTSFIQVTP